MAPILQARLVKTVKVLCRTNSGFNTNSGFVEPEEFVHIGSDCGYKHTVMYVEIPRDWVTGRSTSITSEAGLMYSPALVTLHNIAEELGYGTKTMSQKGKVPNSIGQQSCFSLQNTF